MDGSEPPRDEVQLGRHGEGCFKTFTWLAILAVAGFVGFVLFLLNGFKTSEYSRGSGESENAKPGSPCDAVLRP